MLDRLNAPFITDLTLVPDEYVSFNLTEWLTHGQNSTGPASHPFLARFNQVDKSRTLASFWEIVPIALRKTGLRQDLPMPGSIGFAAITRRRRGRFELGWIGEAKGLMNSIGDGALKLGPSHTAIFTVGTDYDLSEDLSVTANAHLTFSELLPFSDSLIRGTERAVSSAFDVALNYENFNLQLSQPTYFETGILKLSRPERRREDGSVVFRNDEISLRSPERPVLLSLTREGDASRFGLKVEKHSGLPTQYKLAYQLKF